MKVTGVMHMHSTYSYDGKVPLVELKALLVARGVSFCCMTEHTDELTPDEAKAFVKECRLLSDDSFVYIPGFEVPYKDAHVLHIGTTEFLGQTADAESLPKWRRVSPVVILAHPVRNRFKVDETLQDVIDGVEIWNQQYEGKQAPRFRSLKLYWKIKTQKSGLLATSGLDLHRPEHFGSPQLEIELTELTESTILNVLKQGDYISVSSGAVIDARGRFIRGGGLVTRFKSLVSIMIIGLGKFTNKLLASIGIGLPKSLRQFIRARV